MRPGEHKAELVQRVSHVISRQQFFWWDSSEPCPFYRTSLAKLHQERQVGIADTMDARANRPY
jgi:hypothetical protein